MPWRWLEDKELYEVHRLVHHFDMLLAAVSQVKRRARNADL